MNPNALRVGTPIGLLPLLFSLSLTGLASSQDNPAADELVSWSDLVKGNSKLKFYGFLRLDSQFDDSRFNDPQIPGYVRSEDKSAPGGVPAGVVADEDDAELAFHARLTRMGAEFGGLTLDGLGEPSVFGRIEMDFYNIGLGDSDSRNALRMRRAYLELDWGDWSLLAGQEWDLISPLYPAVNSDLVMWGAGNTGDRRPQVRLQNETALGDGVLKSQLGLGLAGAVSSPTVVGGLRSGENSSRPMVSARVGYQAEGGIGAGVWGHVARDEYDNDGAGPAGEETFESNSIGVDLSVPLAGDETWLKAEAWSGENLDDIRGGIFQGVNAAGKEIGAKGGFAELGHKLSEHVTLSVGYSMDDPDDGDLDSFMRSKNEVAYATSVWKYGDVRFGLEYLNWTTDYIDLDSGEANRLVAWIALYF